MIPRLRSGTIKNCLCTLVGHDDIIRTVQFHHEYPWILSASDDQTVRIWNWPSQNCVSIFKGHNHFVMSASFHPGEDLMVSASLDHTVRVWDIGALRKKTIIPPTDDDGLLHLSPTNAVDGIVKYVLQGHARGVNWATFHPTSPLIVSGAYDHQVKLWQMNETKAWEVERTLQGHTNNVSCVLVHSKQDIIISNSEDRSIRVWDANKRRTVLQSFCCGPDRFWTLAIQPEMDLLAAGHDSGMMIFKLERERPAFAFGGDSMFYTKGGYLWHYEFSTQRDSKVVPLPSPTTISYSPKDNAVLIYSDLDGGSYQLFIIPKDRIGRSDFVLDAKKGIGNSAVFISRDWFAVLEKSTNQVLVKNLKNKLVKKVKLPIPTDAIFYAGTAKLLCTSEGKVVLFDLQENLVLGDLDTPVVRCVWSNDRERVALLSKHTITIASKTLDHQLTIDETIRVKSGAWDANGVFMYTSSMNIIKYCLPNGHRGIVTSLVMPTYIIKVAANRAVPMG